MTRFEVLKLLYEHNPLRMESIPIAQARDILAFIKQLSDEGYVQSCARRHGPFYLSDEGRALYLELQDAVDKELQQHAQNKRSSRLRYLFDFFLFVLGLVVEHFGDVFNTAWQFFSSLG